MGKIRCRESDCSMFTQHKHQDKTGVPRLPDENTLCLGTIILMCKDTLAVLYMWLMIIHLKTHIVCSHLGRHGASESFTGIRYQWLDP